MKKYLLLIPAALLIIGAFILLTPKNAQQTTDSNSTSPSSETTQQADNEVIIKNFEFSPSKLRIKAGTTVTWTNQDGAKHDITPDNPSDAFKASKLLARGESYSFTFTEAGTYEYHCSPHPYMKATIEVTE